MNTSSWPLTPPRNRPWFLALLFALVAVALPLQAQFGSDDFSTGISATKWTTTQQQNGTMTVVGANGHASFLVAGSASSEQEARLIWNGRPKANADWTAEVRVHNAAGYSANGSSAFSLFLGDPRAFTGGTPYAFGIDFSRGEYPG